MATAQSNSKPGDRRRRRPPKIIAYLFGRFPTVSETFLLREINALRARGVVVLPLSMAPGEGPVHREAKPWLDLVVVRPRLDPATALSLLLSCAARYPAGWLSACRMAASMMWRYPARAREVLVALFSAFYFAKAAGAMIDHVHAAFASYPATAGLLLAELLGCSFSFAAHARDIFTAEASFIALKLREAQFAVACSKLAWRHLVNAAPASVRDRVHLVRHGIDPHTYTRHIRQTNPRPIIVSAGRLVPKKGFRHLLNAVALIMRTGIDFELHIYGDGPDAPVLRELIRALQLEDYVRLHGFVPHEQLMVALQHADIFVLASVAGEDNDNEGVPNVLIEALALEVPVVATSTGGIPELIQDNVTGLLAQPADFTDLAAKIQRLLSDSALRRALAAAGRQKVQREYSIWTNIEPLRELFARYVRSLRPATQQAEEYVRRYF